MSEISELERRITAAMDRIATGVEALSAAPLVEETPETEDKAGALAEELAELKALLEEEKLANAQLGERIKALKTKLAKKEVEVDQSVSALKGEMAALDAQLQELKASSEALRASNEALRAAQEQGLADAGLINAGLAAELSALKAERGVEAAETAAIVAALEPLLAKTEEKEAADA